MSTFDGWIEGHGHTIRVDRFTRVEGEDNPAAYLLSHSHSDHYVGLSEKDHGIYVYCTRETADLIANNATAMDRVKHQCGFTTSLERPMLRLKTGLKRRKSNVDDPAVKRDRDGIFRYLEYDQPTRIDVGDPSKIVMVTAIDANHSPGSAMFLIETLASLSDPKVVHAALYTGDLRCDTDFVERLRSHRLLRRYILPEHRRDDAKGKGRADGFARLDCIYLDTAGGFSTGIIPSKNEGVAATLELIDYYPIGTKFSFSTWTTGYEEMVAHIAEHLRMPIHVDQHALGCFKAAGVRSDLLTTDLIAAPTLLHACGKNWRCDEVWSNGIGAIVFSDEEQRRMRSDQKFKRNAGCGCAIDDPAHLGRGCRRPDPNEGLVVFVNGVEPFTTSRYADYHASMVKKLGAARRGDPGAVWPANIIVPYARHSVLPELRAFVQLFAPASLHPNTIYDQKEYVDYYALPRLYGDLLPPEAIARIRREAVDAHQRKCQKDRRPFKPRYHYGLSNDDPLQRSLEGYWLRDAPESREALRGVADNFVGTGGEIEQMLEVLGAVPSHRPPSPQRGSAPSEPAPLRTKVEPPTPPPQRRAPLERGSFIVQHGSRAIRVDSLSGSQLAAMSLPTHGLAGQHRLQRHADIVASASAASLAPSEKSAPAPIVPIAAPRQPTPSPPRPAIKRVLSRESLAELNSQPRSPPISRRVPTWASSVQPSTSSSPPQPHPHAGRDDDVDSIASEPRPKRPKNCRVSGEAVPPRRSDQTKAERPPDGATHVDGRPTDVYERYLNNIRRSVSAQRARFKAAKAGRSVSTPTLAPSVDAAPAPGSPASFETVANTTTTDSTQRKRSKLSRVTDLLFAPRGPDGSIALSTP